MRNPFPITILFALLSPWHFLQAAGYLLPSKQLQLPRIFSQKRSNANISLNSAASNRLTNDLSGDYRKLAGQKKTSQTRENRKKVMVGTLNLIKAMAGTGILALPMGVAKSSDFKTSIIPAIALMSVLGIASAYTFILYGRLIHDSQAKSLGELWEKKMNKNTGMK